MSASLSIARSPHFGFTLPQIRTSLIWLLFASSFVVRFEPAPCDFLFILAFVLFVTTGQNIPVAILPLAAMLILYNIGGLTSFIQVYSDPRAQTLVFTSVYMALSAVFFACFVAENPNLKMEIIKNGYLTGATIAAVLGIMGKFNLAGFGETFTVYDRAVGLFKDPNVYSTYLILPTLMLLQSFMLGKIRHRFFSACSLMLLLAALVLAFSRGAWLNLCLAAGLMVVFTFILTSTSAMRGRIVLSAIAAILAMGLILVILLSFPDIHAMFAERFVLVKSYDTGETGRFGNQLNAIPLLLQRPLGFGPNQFSALFGQDPHNTFLNSFASYGWLGGITYFVLIISTLMVGLKTIALKTPWQHHAILVYSAMTAMIFQGVQVDTEHWRHFYWMLGLNWGLFAASLTVAKYNMPEAVKVPPHVFN